MQLPKDGLLACASSEALVLGVNAKELAKGVPPILDPNFMSLRRWACFALEDELQGDAALRLAQACKVHGFETGWSVEIPWEAGERSPEAHRFAISARVIQGLSKGAYIGSCFVLAESSGSFAIASDGDLYWMLAGPLSFVEEATGLSATDAFTRFGKAARAYGDTVTGSRLSSVYHAALGAYDAQKV